MVVEERPELAEDASRNHPTDSALHIVTVCLGNICRSPLMERLLSARLGQRAHVESFGLIAPVGRAIHPLAATELLRLGGSTEGFAARRLQVDAIRDADLVLTATADVKSRVLTECPSALRRTFTLLEFAHLIPLAPPGPPATRILWASTNRSVARGVDVDLPDPIGGDEGLHRQVADTIDAATQVCAAELAG